LRIGVQIAGLRQPLKLALATASRLGAEGIELDARSEIRPDDFSQTAARHLRKLLDDLRLSVCGVALPTRRGFGDAEGLEARMAATRAALRLSHRLGCSILLIRSDDATAEPTSPAGRLAREVLAGLAAYGLHVGTRLVLCCGATSGEELARFLGEFPEGSLVAGLDPASLILRGFSPLEAIFALGSRIAYVHGTDAVRQPGAGTEVSLGRGMADFPALLGALEESDYRGWICVARHGAPDPPGEIANAIRYLKNV
jgi:sugar phosphate isomerase/epimerase